MRIRTVKPNIWYVEFVSEYEMSSTFIRINEIDESAFGRRNKRSFTIDDFSDWYVRKFGKWDYFDKWGGFSICDTSFKRFLKICGADLRKKEKVLVSKLLEFQDMKYWSKAKYCIIASIKGDITTFDHEIRHAMYHLNKDYKSKVDKVIGKFSLRSFRKFLMSDGYDRYSLTDEIQAYASTGWPEKCKVTKEMRKLKRELGHIEV